MSYILIVTIAIVIFSLIFDFINGFHDTANAVATAVSTRALTPRRAILLAAGYGKRLGSITKKKPKCLLPVNGIPLLDIW